MESTIQIDEQPVGQKNNNFAVNELPDDEQDDQQADNNAPLATRLKSKAPKVKQKAIEDLTLEFESQENDEFFQQNIPLLTKFLEDSNPAVQEKAVLATQVAIKYQKSSKYLEFHKTFKLLIEKCLGSGKPNVKKCSQECIIDIFEKLNKEESFEILNSLTKHKLQKVIIVTVQTILDLLANYGLSKLDNLKPFLGSIEKLAGTTVAPIRNEAMQFYKEAYKWLGDALKPMIQNKIKKAQYDELEVFFNEYQMVPMQPLRMPLIQIQAISNKSGDGNITEKNNTANIPQIDAYDLADPVDVINKFNEKWCDKVLLLQKWTEKKTKLQELIDALNVIKLANGNVQPIFSMLKRLFDDPNVNIVCCAIKIASLLGKGLRKQFVHIAKLLTPQLVIKLKDKKKQIVDETFKTFENFFYCFNLEDVSTDLIEALNDKNPQLKINVVQLLTLYVEKNQDDIDRLKNLQNSMIKTIVPLTQEGSLEVRESTFILISKMKAYLKDKIDIAALSEVNSTKLSKIEDLEKKLLDGGDSQKQNTKGLGSTLKSTDDISIKKKADIPTQKDKTSTKKEINEETKMNFSSSGQLSQDINSSSRLKTEKNSTTSAININLDDYIVDIPIEQAEESLLKNGFPESIINSKIDEKAEKKVILLQEIEQVLINTEFQNVFTQNAENIAIFLKNRTKNFKEANLNVIKQVIQLVFNLSEKLVFTRKSFMVLFNLFNDKLTDGKHTQIINNTLWNMAYSVGPGFIFICLIQQIMDSKQNANAKINQKLLVEIINYVKKVNEELNFGFIPLKESINLCKFILNQNSQDIKKIGMELASIINENIGTEQFITLLGDIPILTNKKIQTELIKTQPKSQQSIPTANQFKGEGLKELKQLDSQQSKQPVTQSTKAIDITKEFDKILPKFQHNDWKIRKEGLEYIDQILNMNSSKISLNGLSELFSHFKKLLNDNKNVTKQAVVTFGKLAEAIGPSFSQTFKILSIEFITNLQDKQASIRAETLIALDKIAVVCEPELIANQCIQILENNESPELRTEFCGWLLKYPQAIKGCSIKNLTKPIINLLQDKSKDIRELAEKLLAIAIEAHSYQPFLAPLKDMKPAQAEALQQIIKKYSNENQIHKTEEDTNQIQNNESQLQSFQNLSLKPDGTKEDRQSIRDIKSPTSTGRANSKVSNKQREQSSGPKPTKDVNNSNNNKKQESQQVIALPVQQIPEKKKALFKITNAKEKRIQQQKPWSTDEIRDDQVGKLKDQLKLIISAELHQQMFNTKDFKQVIEASNQIKGQFNDNFQCIDDNMDLILKWVSYRLIETTNVQLIKEFLDLLDNLIEVMLNNNSKLHELEINIILHTLLNKLGHTNQVFRLSSQKSLVQLGKLTKNNSIASTIVQSLGKDLKKISKNKVESIDTLTQLLKNNGSDIFLLKDVKVISRLIHVTDNAIKVATINLLTQLIIEYGENITREFDNVPQKYIEQIIAQKHEKTLGNTLNEDKKKFKKNAPQQLLLSEEDDGSILQDQINSSTGANNVSLDSNIFEQKSKELTPIAQKADSYCINNSNVSKDDNNLIQTPISEAEIENIPEFQRHIIILEKGAIEQKFDALMSIHDIITDESQETPEIIRQYANQLTQALSLTTKTLLLTSLIDQYARFANYFLGMLHKFSTITIFTKNIDTNNLKNLFDVLIRSLLDVDKKRPQEDDAYAQILTSIIYKFADITVSENIYIALFTLTNIYYTTKANDKLITLTLKILIRETKNIVNNSKKILKFSNMFSSLNNLLNTVENDFKKVPEADSILKTLKTIIYEFIKVYSDIIDQQFQEVKSTLQKPDLLSKWITQSLITYKNCLKDTEINNNETTKVDVNIKVGDNPARDKDIKKAIEAVKQGGNYETVFDLLYSTLEKYPEVDSLEPYLAEYKQSFGFYIIINLEKVRFSKKYPQVFELQQNSMMKINNIQGKLTNILKNEDVPEQKENTKENQKPETTPSKKKPNNSTNANDSNELDINEINERIQLIRQRYGFKSANNINKVQQETKKPRKESPQKFSQNKSATSLKQGVKPDVSEFSIDSKDNKLDNNKTPVRNSISERTSLTSSNKKNDLNLSKVEIKGKCLESKYKNENKLNDLCNMITNNINFVCSIKQQTYMKSILSQNNKNKNEILSDDELLLGTEEEIHKQLDAQTKNIFLEDGLNVISEENSNLEIQSPDKESNKNNKKILEEITEEKNE